MEVSRKEIYRYLGCRGNVPDEATVRLTESCIAELEKEITPLSLYREYPLSVDGEDIGCPVLHTSSASLGKNLKDCTRILLFAATLGSAPDRLIQKYSRLQVSRAVTIQAASAAMIEAWCNEECTRLKTIYEKQGLYLRPRFSPGYGDFSLECQPMILGPLEAGKRIGITLTDSLLMMPSKSVSAVMGAGTAPLGCVPEGCEICTKKNCAYRRSAAADEPQPD
ncbi:MAG: Vitamin B12 dependent methionine synthase activation subunit [Lachnospiraceae bacterium]|jgi:hypothetical protein|nr:Vitamin B12 dependent methionine synthase activation subunit [Lachnospiraceae bacterium]MCI1726791.1 Vitamin B12 dependent methionine synthase activation subunit [Lachnospiraceae bacterium]